LEACIPPPGSLPDAAPCRDSGQCQSSHCLVPDNALDGTCAPAPAGTNECYEDDDCASGYLCDQASNSFGYVTNCHAAVGEGSVCNGSNCAKNLDCIPDSCTICPPMPTCKRPDTVHYTCTNPYAAQCDDLQGLYCSVDGTCQFSTLVGAGQPCSSPG